MNRIGLSLLLLAIGWFGINCQPAAGASPYALHAKITHQGNGHFLVAANSPRPMLQALTGIDREYGWVIDYEEGAYRTAQMARGPDSRYRLIGGAFQVELPEPQTGIEAEETSILQQLVDGYNGSLGASLGIQFTVLHRASSQRYDVISESGGTPLLDTPIVLPPAERTIDLTIDAIRGLVAKARSVVFTRGGVADSELDSKMVTVGSTDLLPARQYLVQALDQTTYARIYNVGYSASMGSFAIEIHTAIRVEKTVAGGLRVVPVPNLR